MSASTALPLNHVAIIMDGNNRWARDRDLPALSGHQVGAERLRDVVEACQEHDIRCLTVFAFSSENWKRSREEVSGLMSLFTSYLRNYRKHLVDNSIRLRVIGRRDRFSTRLTKLITEVESATKGGERVLVIAADYGGQWDIADTFQRIAARIASGEIATFEITEALVQEHVALGDLPPPDLLIRTGGDHRISNFLLWQIAYTELYFTDCYWPDFDRAWFNRAVEDYQARARRFGGRN